MPLTTTVFITDTSSEVFSPQDKHHQGDATGGLWSTFTPALTHTAMTQVISSLSPLSVQELLTQRDEIIASLLVTNNANRRFWV